GAITIAPRNPQTKKQVDPVGKAVDEEADTEATPPPTPEAGETIIESKLSPAPVASFVSERGALLIDYPHGRGRIVLLSDPYIVANNGINRADNLQLAINVIGGDGGLAAFDEFHQGRASTHNALIQYFEGTPVLAICGQLALIGLAIVW